LTPTPQFIIVQFPFPLKRKAPASRDGLIDNELWQKPTRFQPSLGEGGIRF
jgi:hypothetical protein